MYSTALCSTVAYTVKKLSVSLYPRMFVASFSDLDGTGSVTVCIGASIFRRFTDTNAYETGSVKIQKSRHIISVDIRILLQCSECIN